MSAATKIRRDCHGLFVRTNGSVFRPQESEHSYYIKHIYPNENGFSEGEQARVSFINGSPNCKVVRGDYLEVWYAHGVYGRYGQGSSENCWDPKPLMRINPLGIPWAF